MKCLTVIDCLMLHGMVCTHMLIHIIHNDLSFCLLTVSIHWSLARHHHGEGSAFSPRSSAILDAEVKKVDHQYDLRIQSWAKGEQDNFQGDALLDWGPWRLCYHCLC